VPGWVWLAGSAAAVVVVVVVVLIVSNGSSPGTPDGPPVAAKGPGGDDRPKDADKKKKAGKAKDTDKRKDAKPDSKKDKKDKTDAPEKPAPLPRLVAFPKLSLPERGAADLQVKVERQGYAGPIKLQVENLPPGVTCQRSATIPAGESSLRLEFRTDGTAAEGTATVEVIATADTRTADRRQLSLVIPPQPLPDQFKNTLGMEFVRIPKGKSWLGGSAGKPGLKEVEIKRDFYLGKFEVTQEQWQAVMGRNPSYFSRTGQGKDKVQDIKDEDLKQFPVEMVSYEDAKMFVAELNKRCKQEGWVYRLPTEAEWEYACRGGPMTDRQESAFDWYFDKPTNQLLKGQANFDLGRPCKVGLYPPNRLGLHDMHGNLWEWCDDALPGLPGPHYIAEGASPRVVERGSCFHNAGDYFRTSARISFPPTRRNNDHGFRVARVPISPEKK
jgi:formylglycine-generating enzyme required for sulfatase activity